MRGNGSASVCLLALSLSASWIQRPQPARDPLAGDPSRLVLEHVTATRVPYRGRDAIRVAASPDAAGPAVERIATVPGIGL